MDVACLAESRCSASDDYGNPASIDRKQHHLTALLRDQGYTRSHALECGDMLLPLGLGFGLIKANNALLLNIASSISCYKLAGVALARCLSRQVKNDPPTADRTDQLAGWAMGVLGRPIPRAPGAGGRYIGLEWAVASRFRPSQGG